MVQSLEPSPPLSDGEIKPKKKKKEKKKKAKTLQVLARWNYVVKVTFISWKIGLKYKSYALLQSNLLT